MNKQMMANLHKGKTLSHDRAAGETRKMEAEAPRESAADIVRRLAFAEDEAPVSKDKKKISEQQ